MINPDEPFILKHLLLTLSVVYAGHVSYKKNASRFFYRAQMPEPIRKLFSVYNLDFLEHIELCLRPWYEDMPNSIVWLHAIRHDYRFGIPTKIPIKKGQALHDELLELSQGFLEDEVLFTLADIGYLLEFYCSRKKNLVNFKNQCYMFLRNATLKNLLGNTSVIHAQQISILLMKRLMRHDDTLRFDVHIKRYEEKHKYSDFCTKNAIEFRSNPTLNPKYRHNRLELFLKATTGQGKAEKITHEHQILQYFELYCELAGYCIKNNPNIIKVNRFFAQFFDLNDYLTMHDLFRLVPHFCDIKKH